MTGYEALEPVGDGGAVFRARRVSDGAPVAVKHLHAAGNPAWTGNVAGRARRVAGLAPALPRIFEVTEEDGGCTIAMEYAPAGSLAGRLEDGPAGPPQRVAGLFASLAEGLAAAHQAGVLHLDVKPTNVLFRSDAEAFLSDFGHDPLAETTGQPAPGGAEYFDPAVAAGRPPDARSDVYSLAAVCYHALAGAPPFPGASLVEIADAARVGAFRPLAEAAPGVAPGLAAAVERAMDRTPERRYQGAGDFAEALRAAAGMPAAGPLLPEATPAREANARQREVPWRRVGLALGLAAVLIAAAAVASPLVGRNAAKRPATLRTSPAASPGDGGLAALVPTQTAAPSPGLTGAASSPKPSLKTTPPATHPAAPPTRAAPAVLPAAQPTAPAPGPTPARLPPKGQRIAFTGTHDGTSAIYVTSPTGAPVLRLTNSPTDGDSQPDWSPDGTRIVFTSTRDGRRQLYVMNADGTGQQRLSVGTGNDDSPAWSPDGSTIAYVGDAQGSAQVFVMPATGGAGTRIGPTPVAASYSEPAWSPDGKKIACTQSFAGYRDIIAMNPDGSGAVPVASTTGPPTLSPDWSPDGTKVAYTAIVNGLGRVSLMAPDGSGVVQLSARTSYDQLPTWSPAGDRIVFISNYGSVNQVWLMGADGANPTLLTHGPEIASDPAWG